jgi:hypothetical protein
MDNIEAIDIVRLADVCGGADEHPAVHVGAGTFHAGWAMKHYDGMYNILRDCAENGHCVAPNRMQAGAGLGALGVPATEIADRLKGRSLSE